MFQENIQIKPFLKWSNLCGVLSQKDNRKALEKIKIIINKNTYELNTRQQNLSHTKNIIYLVMK